MTENIEEKVEELEHCFNCEYDYPKGEHGREICQYLNR